MKKDIEGTVFKKLREEYNDERPNNEKRLTQKDIATAIGCQTSHICRLEKGIEGPQPDDYRYYTKKFGVTVEYLLGLSQSKTPRNMRVGEDLGVNDDVADTLAKVHQMSYECYNIEAVLHAFIGNGDETISFLMGILNYLTSEEANGINYRDEGLIYNRIMTYINTIVRPQLKGLISKRIAEDEALQDYRANMTLSQEEIDYFNQIPDSIPDNI